MQFRTKNLGDEWPSCATLVAAGYGGITMAEQLYYDGRWLWRLAMTH